MPGERAQVVSSQIGNSRRTRIALAWRCRNHALALDKTARIAGEPAGRHERLSPSAARHDGLGSPDFEETRRSMSALLAKAPTEPRAFIAWDNRRRARYELIGGEVR